MIRKSKAVSKNITNSAAEAYPGAAIQAQADSLSQKAACESWVWEWTSDNRAAFWHTWREMLTEIYEYRELLAQLVLRDLRIRYKQAVMGFAWAVFMPLLIVAAGCLVKIALAHASGNGVDVPRVAGMSVKALAWAFFAGAVGFSANSLVANMALVTKVYFPRELFPLSAVITQLIDTMVAGCFLSILLVAFAHLGFSLSVLWLPCLLLLLVLQTLAASLLFSCGNVFFRDVKYLVQVILTFGIFFTPVFYEPELFGPRGAFLMMLNPLSPILEGLRLAIVDQHNLFVPVIVASANAGEVLVWHVGFLLYSTIWAVVGLALCWWLFHRSEFLFPEYV